MIDFLKNLITNRKCGKCGTRNHEVKYYSLPLVDYCHISYYRVYLCEQCKGEFFPEVERVIKGFKKV